METEVVRMKEQIETLKKQRAEIEAVLVMNRENVSMWLAAVLRACNREIYQLKDNGDIADGEIQYQWDLLQGAIAGLRETQEVLRHNSDCINDFENDLHEEEHPF